MEQIGLSPREKQILEIIFTGKQKKEIAVMLNLTESAIRWHVMNLHRKFSAGTTTEVIYKALQQGHLTVPFAEQS